VPVPIQRCLVNIGGLDDSEGCKLRRKIYEKDGEKRGNMTVKGRGKREKFKTKRYST
jgi:hypothetical protein